MPGHSESRHSRDCADGFQHHWALGYCCTPRVREKMLGRQAEFVYLSSSSRFVRSRDQRQRLSQTSRARRTTQRASHVPSGFPQASHSFLSGSRGLLRCVEIARRVIIAIICSRTRTIRRARINQISVRVAKYLLTWERSTITELMTDTSSLRALLFRPYPKKTRMRPAMESLC